MFHVNEFVINLSNQTAHLIKGKLCVYRVELVRDEKKNSDWFPWRSAFCNTDR